MIHIIDDYYVDGNPLNYILVKKTNSVDKKTGEPIYRTINYPSSVAQAVETVRKILCRDLTHDRDMELSEAVKEFDKIVKRLEEATRGLA